MATNQEELIPTLPPGFVLDEPTPLLKPQEGLIPPLPSGFALDEPQIPRLPPGFTLDPYTEPIEQILPEREMPGMRALVPEEEARLREEAMLGMSEKDVKEVKEIAGIFEDPKVNYYAQKISERLPLWLTAVAGAPVIIGIFEGLQQVKNVTMSLAEKSKYDPIAHRMLSEMIPEDAPTWLKTTSFIGEGAVDMIGAALIAKKISTKTFRSNLNRIFKKAKEAGWADEDLTKIKALAEKELRPETIEKEIERAIKIKKGEVPLPKGKRIVEPGVPEPVKVTEPIAIEPVAPEIPAGKPGEIVKMVTKEVEGVGPVQFRKDSVAFWPKSVSYLMYRVHDVTSGRMIAPNADTVEEWQGYPRQFKNKKDGMREDEVAAILEREGIVEDVSDMREKIITGKVRKVGVEPTPEERVTEEYEEWRETVAYDVKKYSTGKLEDIKEGFRDGIKESRKLLAAEKDVLEQQRITKSIDDDVAAIRRIEGELERREEIVLEPKKPVVEVREERDIFGKVIEEEKPPAKALKAPEPTLFEPEVVEVKFPTGFDKRGLRRLKDVNKAREVAQFHVDKGWKLEMGQTTDNKAWIRLAEKVGPGEGELKYISKKVKPEFLAKPAVELKITEEVPEIVVEGKVSDKQIEAIVKKVGAPSEFVGPLFEKIRDKFDPSEGTLENYARSQLKWMKRRAEEKPVAEERIEKGEVVGKKAKEERAEELARPEAIRATIDELIKPMVKKGEEKVFNLWKQGMSSREVAKKVGLSHERVRQIERPWEQDMKKLEPEFKKVLEDKVETEKEKIVNDLYNEALTDIKKKKQAGFIKFEGRKEPPKVSDKKVEDTLRTSLLPMEAKELFKFKMKQKLEGVQRWLVYEPKLVEHPEFKNEVRLFTDVPYDARAESNKAIIATIGKLSREEFEAFRKIVGLTSMKYELENNRQVPGNLTKEQVDAGLADLETWNTGNVKEAIDRHNKLVRATGEDLVAREKLDPGNIKDFYYPHRVLDFKPIWSDWKGIPKRFSKPYRDYAKPRKGTTRALDFDYISAMSDYYQKVHIDNAIDDFMEAAVKKYDISGKVEPGKQFELFGEEKKPRPRGLYVINGEEYKGFQFVKGNILYPATTINEGLWQKAVEEGWTVAEFGEAIGPKGGKALSDALALGAKHKVYLLPKAIAEKLESFRVPAGDLPLFWDARNFTSWWKRITLDFAGIPFQLNNFVGDAINLYKTDPAALEMVRKSASIVWKQLYAPQKLTKGELELLELATKQRVTTTHFFREAGVTLQDESILKKFKSNWNPLNYAGEILTQIEKASVGREETLRLGKFMKDLERISKGESVISKEINVTGLKPIDAAGKAAREFTIDYGAVSPPYRRFLRGMLTPFMTFYDYNARNWVKYAIKHPGELAIKIGVPTVAMFIWNNTGKRKEVEEHLGFWRYLPHINTGFKTKKGKDIVIALQTPVDMAASWFGLDRFPSKVTDIINGKMTIKEAAVKQLVDTGLGAPRQIMRLLNPVIHIFQGLLSNRDPYTRRGIVPERFKGTEYEKKFIAEYIMSQILTPYGQYMRLRNEVELTPKLGTWGAWLAKGPLDIIRALGIRNLELDKYKMAEGYGEREKLTDAIKNKLSIIERAWVDANLMNSEKGPAYLKKRMSKVAGMEGPTPTNEQIINRLTSPRTQIEIATQLIRKTKDERQREALKDYLEQLKIQRFIESMTKYTQKSIRPELYEKLLEFLK